MWVGKKAHQVATKAGDLSLVPRTYAEEGEKYVVEALWSPLHAEAWSYLNKQTNTSFNKWMGAVGLVKDVEVWEYGLVIACTRTWVPAPSMGLGL